MKRKFTSYSLADSKKFKSQLLNFGIRFSNFCFLENNEYNFDKSYSCIAGLGSEKIFSPSKKNSLESLDEFRSESNDWVFGHVSYDYKNQVEALSSDNFDGIKFPDIHFFIPEILLIISNDEVSIGIVENMESQKIFEEINGTDSANEKHRSPQLLARFSKEDYIKTVTKLQEHISRGDCYEICFCQEFFAENAAIDPVQIYQKLNELSPNPFSAFYKADDKFLACASPERFLKKTGNDIMSQPIKGTAKRILSDTGKDEEQKNALSLNEKERAENIMIVDLVRNDLSKICRKASVTVKEFLTVHSFPQVHQMISTIVGKLKEAMTVKDIFEATFPMGSMTGAPKMRAMELIEKYERTKRGLYSGTVGYITPDGDFDFNVVIRSILYNETDQYLSIQTGSAITFKSIPENEYEECIIKLEAMKKALE